MAFKKRGRFGTKRKEKKFKKNHEIRSRRVKVVDNDGNLIGEVSLDSGIRMAEEKNLDLVEVSPNSNPPICKIMSYGKYLYNLSKKQKKQSSKSQKSIRLSFNIAENDLEVKAKKGLEFIKKGHNLRVEIRFKGREIVHQEVGREKIETFLEKISVWGGNHKIVTPIKKQGKVLSVTIEPDDKSKDS